MVVADDAGSVGEASARVPDNRPTHRAIAVVVAILAAGVFFVWVTVFREGLALWQLAGRSADALNSDCAPGCDDTRPEQAVFSALIVLGLAVGAFVRRYPQAPRLVWLQGLVFVLTLAYAVLEVAEWDLSDPLTHANPGMTDGEARALGNVSTVKWMCLAVAVVGVIRLWSRRLPQVPPDEIEWHSATTVPQHLTEEWQPADDRFGIAVSGGGIRSASFSMGVLQELRTEGLLQKARYVTSVSGGSYTTAAMTVVNQPHLPEGADGPDDPVHYEPPADDGYAPGTPEEQRLRRSLRYFVANPVVVSGAIARIVLGLLINLLLFYAVVFALFRPFGWLAGTPALQEGLRIDDPVAVDLLPKSEDCGEGAVRDRVPQVREGDRVTIARETPSAGWEVDVDGWHRCVLVVTPERADRREPIRLTQTTPGVVAVVDGALAIERQPVFGVADDGEINGTLPSVLATAVAPTLELSGAATGIDEGATGAEVVALVSVANPPSLDPVDLLDRRDGLDFDAWHSVPGIVLLVVAVLLLGYRTVVRPDNYADINRWASWSSAAGGVWLTIFVVIPWLAGDVPEWLVSLQSPSDDASESANWLPFKLSEISPLLAWPILAVASISRFLAGAKSTAPSEPTKKRRGTSALLKKVGGALQRIVVALVLLVFAVGSIMTVLVAGAFNGPWGDLPWLSDEVFGLSLRGMPPDIVLWTLIAGSLMFFVDKGESASWSPGPIYKRQLKWAFDVGRSGDGVEERSYRDDYWADLAPRQGAPATIQRRAGYLDVDEDDGTGEVTGAAELVLCCAANVTGEQRSPTGRNSVSFTASRSVIGGPEIGWMSTDEYYAQMGKRRRWDINIPGLAAISGAAVSPSMGRKNFGAVGSVLAMLNVRLGAWIPNPQWVEHIRREVPDYHWTHNPSWTWFAREVLRIHRNDAAYLYVSDGGHWENTALVEALRRGCTTIVAISAAGDGAQGMWTFGEAVEIARSDLGVEIDIPDIWKLRPKIADPAGELDSGREFIEYPGPDGELGRAAERGFAYGTFTHADGTAGEILLLDAAMIDRLPVDTHSYAESNPEFPNISTGDQLFTNRDFEAYRTLGRQVVRDALAHETSAPSDPGQAAPIDGAAFRARVAACERVLSPDR